MRLLAGRAGRINFTTILLLLVLAAAVYLAVMLVPPYVENYKFKEKLEAVANMAHREKNDDVLESEIQRELKQLDMTLPADAVTIERDPEHGRWIRITARYIRQVELVPFGKVVSLEFDSDVFENLNK